MRGALEILYPIHGGDQIVVRQAFVVDLCYLGIDQCRDLAQKAAHDTYAIFIGDIEISAADVFCIDSFRRYHLKRTRASTDEELYIAIHVDREFQLNAAP